jgi:hypothetical protein
MRRGFGLSNQSSFRHHLVPPPDCQRAPLTRLRQRRGDEVSWHGRGPRPSLIHKVRTRLFGRRWTVRVCSPLYLKRRSDSSGGPALAGDFAEPDGGLSPQRALNPSARATIVRCLTAEHGTHFWTRTFGVFAGGAAKLDDQWGSVQGMRFVFNPERSLACARGSAW